MEKGIVFSIEEFAIHDGPGIRTTVFLKGCPLRCAWCHNPEGISPEPQYMDRRDGRTMCGYAICSGELAGKLLRNKAVYAMNRGGVTLTGGEPLLQAAFAAEVLAALQAAGVHTAVETSGYAAPDVFRRVAGHADLVLFDVKHADPVQHRRWTGVDNAPILRNLQCWVAPRQFALPHAGKAFTPFGTLVHEASHEAVQGVVDQVMLAAGRLHPGT